MAKSNFDTLTLTAEIMQLPKSIRKVIDPIVSRLPVPIVGGVNKGMLWSLASSGGGYVTGLRGAAQMAVIGALIRKDDIVWDVGAHHGSVVLYASRLVGPTGQVHAFEPGEMSRSYLRLHVEWNRLSNVTIHPYALNSYDGDATFGGSGSSTSYALNAGEERVTVRTVKTIVESGVAPAPTFAKLDVEDAEDEVLRGAVGILPSNTRLVTSIHSARSYTSCVAILRGAGYQIVESRELTSRLAGAWGGDPDMVCFGPGYAEAERDSARLRTLGF